MLNSKDFDKSKVRVVNFMYKLEVNWSTRQRPTFPFLNGRVLSAMRGLASGFGMGPGVSLSL